MTLNQDRNKNELRAAGWYSRGYLPHFDGRALPQFISLHLADSVPQAVVDRWRQELDVENSDRDRILLQHRLEKYADQGFGKAYLRDEQLAEMVQKTLMNDDGKRYELSSWVVMPNHVHMLFTRSEEDKLAEIMQAFKSITSHKANKLLRRSGEFWMPDYFDRFIRNSKHYQNTVEYIENNPVKARLCAKPEDFRFSSAWFRHHSQK